MLTNAVPGTAVSSAAVSNTAVIVVAAGSGSRLGESIPKGFVAVAGRTVLERALDEVFAVRRAVQVVVVVPADRVDEAQKMVDGTHATVVAGGRTRQQSVACGLAALGADVATVLVHDAARALTPTSLIERVIAEVQRTGHGVVPGLAVVNTVKRVDGSGDVIEEVDRSELREVQTPQGFPRAAFAAAHASAPDEFTDDAAVFAAAGHQVSVIQGDPLAFKITTPFDLRRAEQIVGARANDNRGSDNRVSGNRGSDNRVSDIRIGLGVDVHAFDENRPLWLGGVEWPGEAGLAGHSDGDAVCHAICDAMLSAAGLGDLGSRFGTSDPRFANASGATFITETLALVVAAGFRVVNVSVQVVANRPKIGARRAEIERTLSALVQAPVSVGATTTDGLGFTGRGEGVSAIATCQLSRS